MNILFTSAGRRGYLIEYFKETIGKGGAVHAANSINCPAFHSADYSVISPLIYDEEYIPFLLKYCTQWDISMIIPLLDMDLPVLALNKKRFEEQGVYVLVSESSTIEKCNDKWNMFQFGIQNEINVPMSFLDETDVIDAIKKKKLEFPIVIKPRWGTGTLSVYVADNENELYILGRKARKEINKGFLKYESARDINYSIVFQEYLEGKEYGADAINNLNGNFVNAIVKEKIIMRAGETDLAITCQQDKIFAVAKKLSEKLRHIGNLDIDMILVDEKVYVIDLNARFGGGYPFSHMAGANVPKAILEWYKGNSEFSDSCFARIGEKYQKDIRMIVASAIKTR